MAEANVQRDVRIAGLLRWCFGMVAVAFFVGAWLWLAQAPFHEDEAIYAAWALGIARGDWAVWQLPVDKPPLTFYPLAGMMTFGARAEWLVRLSTLLWGVFALYGVGRLAHRLGRKAWVAQGLVLVSPLWWALWASAFTDMAAVALGVLSIGTWVGTEKKQNGVLAGVLMGLAVLAKPTMVLWVPLLMGLGRGERTESGKQKAETAQAGRRTQDAETATLVDKDAVRGIFRSWRGWIEGFSGLLLVAWAWDASRDAPSWWRLGAEAYGTLGRGWGAWLAWGWLALGAVGITIGLGFLLLGYYHGRTRLQAVLRAPLKIDAIILWMILLWVPLHVLLGFQPWERYLLPLVILIAVWVAPCEEKGERGKEKRQGWFLRFSFFASLILLAPFLVAPLHFAPQDGRWNGIQEVGRVIEGLPDDAEVWYGALGRPLAWYAADARATLEWAGIEWQEFPGCGAGRYLAARWREPITQGLRLIVSNENFGVWECPP